MGRNGSEDVTSDWFYEDRVVEILVKQLISAGWTIGHLPSAATKEQGVDITASRDGQLLLVEAKGYPSEYYRDERRRGEIKRTKPENQAQHWFSHALLKAVRMQSKNPKAVVAMAFPEFPRYRTLFEEIETRLDALGIWTFFVDADGNAYLARSKPLSTTEMEPNIEVQSKKPMRAQDTTGLSYSGQYGRLATFFQQERRDDFTLSFDAITSMVDGLSTSAFIYPEWWAHLKGHLQEVWLACSYEVKSVNLKLREIRFSRTSPSRTVDQDLNIGPKHRGKYGRLSSFFEHSTDFEISLSFDEMNSLVGKLPPSASIYRVWWGNHHGNPQAVWMKHGYVVKAVNLTGNQVVFSKSSR